MFGMGVPKKEAEKVVDTGAVDIIDVKGTEVPVTEEPDGGGKTVQDTSSLFGFFADTEFSGHHLRKTSGKRKNQPKGMRQVINF